MLMLLLLLWLSMENLLPTLRAGAIESYLWKTFLQRGVTALPHVWMKCRTKEINVRW